MGAKGAAAAGEAAGHGQTEGPGHVHPLASPGHAADQAERPAKAGAERHAGR